MLIRPETAADTAAVRRPVVMLSAVAVDPDHRRRGVGDAGEATLRGTVVFPPAFDLLP